MNEYLIILIIPLVFLAWKFYFSIATSEEQQEIEDDKYGDYFLKDIKKNNQPFKKFTHFKSKEYL